MVGAEEHELLARLIDAQPESSTTLTVGARKSSAVWSGLVLLVAIAMTRAVPMERTR